MRSTRRDSAFSIVEVVIAMLLMSAVVAAVSLAAVGGASIRSSTKVSAAFTAAGERVEEHLGASRGWMQRDACKVIDGTCSVAGDIPAELLEDQDLDGSFVLGSAVSTAIDSDVDGVGAADEDQLVPDYYRVTFVLSLSSDLAARFGDVPERTFNVTLDRRGASQLGTLAIELCRVTNQADDRMSINGCTESGDSGLEMDGCPPEPRYGCLSAWDWVDGLDQDPREPSPFVSIRRVAPPGGITIENTATGEPGPSGQVVDGQLLFTDLEPGPYRINGLPDSVDGAERWMLKEVPSWHGSTSKPASAPSVVVEPGLRNRALVLFRPARTGGIDLRFERRTRTYRITGPLTSTEQAVDEWAPTDGYVGEMAELVCGLWGMLGENTSCSGIKSVGTNCVNLYASGLIYLYEDDSYAEPLLDENGVQRTLTISDRKAATYCTWYAERYKHTYYAHDTSPDYWTTRKGAATGGNYRIEPRPDDRVVEALDGGGFEMPIAQCEVASRGQCESPIRDLVPGLNSPLIRESGAEGADITDNQYCDDNPCGEAPGGGVPASLTDEPTWVYADGSIATPTGGNLGSMPSYTVTGLGECYWVSPRFSGEEEGDCDPCYPLWEPGFKIVDSCGAILTRTDWTRYGIETMEFYTLQWGTLANTSEREIESKSGVIAYDPPASCDTPIPRLRPGAITCFSRTDPRPYEIETTEHASPSVPGVRAVVKKRQVMPTS